MRPIADIFIKVGLNVRLTLVEKESCVHVVQKCLQFVLAVLGSGKEHLNPIPDRKRINQIKYLIKSLWVPKCIVVKFLDFIFLTRFSDEFKFCLLDYWSVQSWLSFVELVCGIGSSRWGFGQNGRWNIIPNNLLLRFNSIEFHFILIADLYDQTYKG